MENSNHLNVSDLSFADMESILAPSLMDNSADNSGQLNMSQQHQRQSNEEEYQEFYSSWAGSQTPFMTTPGHNAVGRATTDFSPLSIEKVEELAKQLNSGIEPYIPSATFHFRGTGDTTEQSTIIYNSTPYDSLLYAPEGNMYYDTNVNMSQPDSNGLPKTSMTPFNGENKENASAVWTTPKKMEMMNSNIATPSTVVLSSAQQQRTILRQRSSYANAVSPIRAVKTSSFTKLIAEASDTSPAKGRFFSRNVLPNVNSAVSAARTLSAPSSENTSIEVNRPMTASMSSFQVNIGPQPSLSQPRDRGAITKKSRKPKAKKARSLGTNMGLQDSLE